MVRGGRICRRFTTRVQPSGWGRGRRIRRKEERKEGRKEEVFSQICMFRPVAVKVESRLARRVLCLFLSPTGFLLWFLSEHRTIPDEVDVVALRARLQEIDTPLRVWHVVWIAAAPLFVVSIL
ncbi:MAG: hypothetical protein O7D30_08545, partial [Rickettsia endosymbiont of Ixodes persulcatus]|nr:hypothetical protein [Rickettsia endosymbiont of Ixodes persulcatus]